MASDPMRALLVAGHPVILGVLRLACASAGVQEAGHADRGRDVLERLAEDAPTVVVLDLELPDRDGLEVLRDLRTAGFGGSVLVVSDRTDGTTVLEVMRAGADGYLVKPDGLRRVGQALRELAAGGRVLDPSVEKVAVIELGRFAWKARKGSEVGALLTTRERQVLRLLADGLTTQQVARRLEISPRTVETHVAKLYRKLSVRSRMQAIARAAQLGLIELR